MYGGMYVYHVVPLMHMGKSQQKKYYFEQSVRICSLVLLIWIIKAIKVPAAGKPVEKYEKIETNM